MNNRIFLYSSLFLVLILLFDASNNIDHRANETHEMSMYVFNSDEQASEENRVNSFDDYLLLNGETIEVHYKAR